VDTTVPVPSGPFGITITETFFNVKVAVTVLPPAATVTTQAPLPLHGAPQATVDPVCGVAIKVTCVPG